MPRFLLVSPRHGLDIAHAERRDFLTNAALHPHELEQRLLDSCHTEIGDTSQFAGIFVGGSPLNVTSESFSPEQLHVHHELSLLFDQKIPVFLVCFGTGLLAHINGGTVGRTHPETCGQTIVTLTEEGKADPITSVLPQTFTALAGHTENVTDPGSTTVLGVGPTCPYQILRHGDHVWACQFHAEMNAEAMHTRMDFYKDYGYFQPAEYDRIVATLPSVNTVHAAKLLQSFVHYCANS